MAAALRVGFDVTPLLGTPTGVGTFAAHLLNALAQQGDLDLHGYGLTWKGRGSLAGLVPQTVSVGSRPMAARPLRKLWTRHDLPPIEWWTGALDVVHGTNFVVPPTRRAAAMVTVHDLTCVRFPELCTPDTLEYPALLRRALRRGAFVHAVSQFVADEVVDLLGADPDRVHVVHHGLPDVSADRALVPSASDQALGGQSIGGQSLEGQARGGHALVGAQRYVLALGTVEPRKDLSSLVRAFDRVAGDDPALFLAIAGPDGWGAAELGATISGAVHRERIRRLGWVSDAERSALLAGATVFAYPSLYEGFGFPPIEAMSLGIPVVTTTAGALPEVLGDAALFASPGSVEDLADHLRRLLDDEACRESLITRGRARSARYRWEVCAREMTRIYRTISGK